MTRAGSITTHVLDTSCGLPAAGLRLRLERLGRGNRWELLGERTTSADGRAEGLTEPGSLEPGRFRIRFSTGEYFSSRGVTTLFPRVTVELEIAEPGAHYHVPLLLGPFAYSTYRGS